MGFVPFNNVIKIEGICILNDQRVENVHYYLVDETPSVETCEALAISYREWWDAKIRPMSGDHHGLVMVKATIMETQYSPGIEYTAMLPNWGLLAEETLPNNVTAAVKWLTGLRGRSYRGRSYHVGLRDSQVQNNTLTNPTITALMAAYGELMALDTDVGPAIMCIASRFEGNVERTVGVATPVINLAVDSTVDSQRRRLPGRGQ